MNLEDIKKNLNVIANSILRQDANKVDVQVILLLTIASTLVLQLEKDKVDYGASRNEDQEEE